jgi:hypothetical protein
LCSAQALDERTELKTATALKVSADDLLELELPTQPPKSKQDPETKRLWKRFRQLLSLPEKDQRAVIRSSTHAPVTRRPRRALSERGQIEAGRLQHRGDCE